MLFFTVEGRKRKLACGNCGHIVDLDIDDLLDHWASWSASVISTGFGGGGGSTLGAAMVKMATQECIQCEKDPKCTYCKGTGLIRMDRADGRAVPGFIHADSTGPHDIYRRTDQDAETIEAEYWAMPVKLASVMFQQYMSKGTQRDKAERLNIPIRTYERRLEQVRIRVAQALEMS